MLIMEFINVPILELFFHSEKLCIDGSPPPSHNSWLYNLFRQIY